MMSEKERKDIAEMVKAAKQLAEQDPQSFLLAKNSLNILKARAEMEQEMKMRAANQEENVEVLIQK